MAEHIVLGGDTGSDTYGRPILTQREEPAPLDLPFGEVDTPCFLTDERRLEANAKLLKRIADALNVKIILAQKAYSQFTSYACLQPYLSGTAASGVYEAKLGRETFGKEVHVYSPAYKESDIEALLPEVDHLIFNSFAQWQRHYGAIKSYKAQIGREISLGLRINPEYSHVETELYNPSAPHSRLGITLNEFTKGVAQYGLDGIDGLHMHTLCEENSDALAAVIDQVIVNFAPWLGHFKWFNLGGGHHLTRRDYDLDLLAQTIAKVQNIMPQAQLYLEPGEAIPYHAGFLVAQVIDVIENDGAIALLDVSASCHMPDVLEMPYRPAVFAWPQQEALTQQDCTLIKLAGDAGQKPWTYRLGGPTCLAGDVIGSYSLDEPLQIGSRLVFTDMALYTMVKTNTFNGMPLPDLVTYRRNGELEVVRRFSYFDFKNRLG